MMSSFAGNNATSINIIIIVCSFLETIWTLLFEPTMSIARACRLKLRRTKRWGYTKSAPGPRSGPTIKFFVDNLAYPLDSEPWITAGLSALYNIHIIILYLVRILHDRCIQLPKQGYISQIIMFTKTRGNPASPTSKFYQSETSTKIAGVNVNA